MTAWPPWTFCLVLLNIFYLHSACSGIHQDKRSLNKFSRHNKLSISRRSVRASQPWATGSTAGSAQTNSTSSPTNTCRGLFWRELKCKQLIGFFYCSQLRGHHAIERQRRGGGGVSAGSENVREKKSRRKWGTERSLRPHNVCFLSVSSVWPILGWRRNAIVRTSIEGFLFRAAEGKLVARPRWEAPQEDNLPRSLCWP